MSTLSNQIEEYLKKLLSNSKDGIPVSYTHLSTEVDTFRWNRIICKKKRGVRLCQTYF